VHGVILVASLAVHERLDEAPGPIQRERLDEDNPFRIRLKEFEGFPQLPRMPADRRRAFALQPDDRQVILDSFLHRDLQTIFPATPLAGTLPLWPWF